ncbi:MAG TPA: hypothetical protein VFX96_15240, partial [Pyrinomonadaceae bacterium]|nr:hypothetical protein [Pyrinomonadaceae bacterium]
MRRRFCVLLCLPLLLLLSAATRARAQGNLLRNADAYEGTTYWRAFGNATVEEGAGGGHVFTLREGGYFIQHARVPDEAAGQYAVFVGEAMCEGCDAKERRGFPNLYGYMMDPGTTHEGGRIYAYVATSGMSYRAGINGWQRLSGIQRVPVGTGTVAFFLRQSIQPRDTSVRQVARFRNLGLYVFPSREAAQAFVS